MKIIIDTNKNKGLIKAEDNFSFIIKWMTCLVLSFAITSSIVAQDSLTQESFVSPVDHTIRLAGSFGELRSNHFHAGIDIKSTKGEEGDNIYAAASGFVSRIKIQRGGYGQVIYMDHPNGYTTVYAHLYEFAPKLESYIIEKQLEYKSYEIDIYPEPQRFNFSQGELIGLMGNTGRSYGPHLHFEIRKTDSEIPENPFIHGIGPTDKRPPLLYAVEAHGLDNEHRKIWSRSQSLTQKNSPKGPVTFLVPAWRVGMAIQTFDLMDNASNKNGVFSIEMRVDDSLYYSHIMERVGFDVSKYINSHIDYAEKIENNRTLTKCYISPGNKLQFYPENTNLGEIEIYKQKARKVDFSIKDYHGNEKRYTCYLKRREPKLNEIEEPIFQKYLKHGEQHSFSLGSCRFFFPKNTLDKNTFINYEERTGQESLTFRINEKSTPIFSYPAVSVPVKHIEPTLHDKVVIIHENKTSYGGHVERDSLRARIGAMGNFSIVVDTIAPTIEVGSFLKNAVGKPYFRFAINDNYETRGYANDLKYDVFIDGNWTIAPLKAIGNVLIVPLDEIENGDHTIKIRVEDDRGNVTIWEREFKT